MHLDLFLTDANQALSHTNHCNSESNRLKTAKSASQESESAHRSFMASNMSQPLKRTKKGAKMGSATLTPEGDELPGSSKSAPIISNSANRNDNPEATASRRSSGSSDGSDNDSPRSMVQGIITVIGERVQTQLSSFLSNEISSLLATVRAEITQEFTKEVQKLKQEHESQIVILKEQLEAQKKTQQKQDEWMALEPKLMDEMTKKQNEYLVLNVGGIVCHRI